MVQPLGNIYINVALASALGAAVGVQEMTGLHPAVQPHLRQPVASFVAAVVGYLAITLTAGLVTGVIERKVRIIR